jgi:hypothetical protein
MDNVRLEEKRAVRDRTHSRTHYRVSIDGNTA